MTGYRFMRTRQRDTVRRMTSIRQSNNNRESATDIYMKRLTLILFRLTRLHVRSWRIKLLILRTFSNVKIWKNNKIPNSFMPKNNKSIQSLMWLNKYNPFKSLNNHLIFNLPIHYCSFLRLLYINTRNKYINSPKTFIFKWRAKVIAV